MVRFGQKLYFHIGMDDVARLTICSAELTEVTKNKKNEIACIFKTVHYRGIQMDSNFARSYGEST